MRYYCPYCRGLVAVEIKECKIGEITEREIICQKCLKTIRKYIYKKDKSEGGKND